MRLLLLSFALTYVSAATTVSKRCGWGPSFWCSSLDNARECMATKHCLDTVWKYQIIKPEATEYCTDCQLVVGELKVLLSDKTTENEIASVAAHACAFLPNPDIEDQCRGIILEYAPQLVQMLNNKINPEIICATVGLCSGLEDRVSPYGVKAHTDLAAPDTKCEDCTKFFQDVQESITSPETVNALMQLFNQTICSKLDSLSDLCMNILKDNIPIFLQILAEQLDPSLTCRVFGFCQGKSTAQAPDFTIPLKDIFKSNRMGSLQYRSGEECDICKQVMQQLVDAIRDRTFQEKVINEVETLVCGALSSLEDTCKQLVEQYAPAAFEFLVNEVDPTTFCEYISLCPVPTLFGKVQPIVQEKPRTQMLTGYVKESGLCILCEEFMQELVNVLDSNETVTTIEEMGDKVCDRLTTDDLTKQCRDFVKKYTFELLRVLTGEIQPKMFCTELSLCTAKLPKVVIPKLNDETCDLCQEFFKEIKIVLANMSTEQLVSELKLVCGEIPVQRFQNTCNQYVAQYGPLVIDLVKSEDPHSLCALVALCNETQVWGKMTVPIPEDLSKVDQKVPTKVTTPLKCEICDTIMEYVKILLENNATDEEILAGMKAACSALGSYSSECQDLVNTYGERIIDLLRQEIDPGAICKEIDLCTSLKKPLLSATSAILSPLNMLPFPKQEKSKVDASPTECIVCKTVVTFVKPLVDSNATEAEILNSLKTLCSKLGNLASECQSLVQEYCPQIIELLKQELDSDVICIQLGFCTSLKNQVSAIISPLNTLPLPNVEKSKVPCETCTLAMNVLKAAVGNQLTKDSIAAGLEALCNRLPPKVQGSCDEFVVTYEVKIINYMMQKLSSGEICKELSLCEAKVASTVEMVPLQTAKEVKVDDQLSPGCMVCKTVMRFVLNYIGENKTESKIQEALDKVCDEFPAIAGVCKEMVNKYESEIINFIKLDFGPEKICEELTLCKSVNLKLVSQSRILMVDDKADNNIDCDLCENGMKFVLNYIGTDKTKAKIQEALDKLCSRIPPMYAEKCQEIVKEYTDVIVKAIIDGDGPEKICQKIDICPKSQLEHVSLFKDNQVPVEDKADNNIYCDFCEKAMNFVLKDIGGDKTEAKIKAALAKLCTRVPSQYAQKCQSIVKQYTDVIVKEIMAGSGAEKICQAMSMCPKSQLEHVTLLKDNQVTVEDKGDNNIYCDVCEKAMKFVLNDIGSDKTEAKIKAALAKFCTQVPSQYAQKCQSIVKQYTDVIVKDIMAGYGAEKICQAMSMCPKSQLEHVTLLKDNQGIKQGDGPSCVICEFVLKRLDDMLNENRTEKAVEKALEVVCSKLPTTITTECDGFVKEYTYLVVKLLVENVKPDQVCKYLGLCTAQSMGSWKAAVKILPAGTVDKPVGAKATPECVLCEFMLKELKNYLKENSSAGEIVKAVKEACSLLPSTISKECAIFVQKYASTIINLLIEEVDPDTICEKIKVCTAALTASKVQVTEVSCVICEFVLKELDDILSANASAAQIKGALVEVCSLLPGTIKSECTSFVDKYSAMIIQLLVNDISPSAVCSAIGLCAQSKMKPALMKPGQVPKGIECDLCKEFCSQIEEYLHQTKTESEIEQLLDESCMGLPDTVTVQCKAMVKKYTPLIIQAMENDMKPNLVCPALQLCPKPSRTKPMVDINHSKENENTLYFHPNQPQRMLGSEKCTWGPGYWCASKENAISCNAVEHCRRHVWKN